MTLYLQPTFVRTTVDRSLDNETKSNPIAVRARLTGAVVSGTVELVARLALVILASCATFVTAGAWISASKYLHHQARCLCGTSAAVQLAVQGIWSPSSASATLKQIRQEALTEKKELIAAMLGRCDDAVETLLNCLDKETGPIAQQMVKEKCDALRSRLHTRIRDIARELDGTLTHQAWMELFREASRSVVHSVDQSTQQLTLDSEEICDAYTTEAGRFTAHILDKIMEELFSAQALEIQHLLLDAYTLSSGIEVVKRELQSVVDTYIDRVQKSPVPREAYRELQEVLEPELRTLATKKREEIIYDAEDVMALKQDEILQSIREEIANKFDSIVPEEHQDSLQGKIDRLISELGEDCNPDNSSWNREATRKADEFVAQVTKRWKPTEDSIPNEPSSETTESPHSEVKVSQRSASERITDDSPGTTITSPKEMSKEVYQALQAILLQRVEAEKERGAAPTTIAAIERQSQKLLDRYLKELQTQIKPAETYPDDPQVLEYVRKQLRWKYLRWSQECLTIGQPRGLLSDLAGYIGDLMAFYGNG